MALGLAAVLSPGCSLGTFDRTECTTSGDCRESFGFGFTCGARGYCDPIVLASRCTQVYPADLLTSPKYANAIVYGNLMDRSQVKQAARERAARLAVMQANQAAPLEGRRFGMVLCTVEENLAFDDLTMDEAAVATARWLTKEVGVPAIVGPSGSASTAAVYQALVGSGTVVISPSATSATLTDLDTTNATDESPGMLWRTAPSDAAQGPAISADMSERAIHRVAIIHQTDPYGQGLANIVSQTYGGDVELFPFLNENERAEAVVTVSNTSVDEVLFIASNTDDIVAFHLPKLRAGLALLVEVLDLFDAAAEPNRRAAEDLREATRRHDVQWAAVEGELIRLFPGDRRKQRSFHPSLRSRSAGAVETTETTTEPEETTATEPAGSPE